MTRQWFSTLEVLQLEIERPATPTEVVNLVENRSGELGGAGWVTPVSGTALRTGDRDTLDVHLAFSVVGAVPNWFFTEPLAVAAGRYVSASWVVPASEVAYYRTRVEWLDAGDAVISSSAQTAYLAAAAGTTRSLGPVLAPAGTVAARLRFDVYANTSGGAPPTTGKVLLLNRVAVASSSSSAPLSGLSTAEAVYYTDVMGPTHEITIERDGLDVGTLNATILDSDLDPSKAGLIRPGRRVRLVTSSGGRLFTGRTLTASAKYAPAVKDQAKRVRIQLSAVDPVSKLAGVTRTEGVSTIAELPYVLEGAGVPWSCNGISDQVPTATVVADNPNASALDQIVITRDSRLGYAWVDRYGVVQVWDRDQIPATLKADLDDDVYNADIDIDYNADACINSVSLTYLRLNAASGQTEEIAYGPYRDEASIVEWGLHHASYTVQGIAETTAALAEYAQAILDANAAPTVRINTVVVPMRTVLDVASLGVLDLYDLVTVQNTAAGLGENSRITSVRHSITPKKWLMTVGFAVDGAAAPATVVPKPNPNWGGGDLGSGGTTVGQLIPPRVPSTPTAVSRLGMLKVTWDGLDYAGQVLKGFDYLELHASTESGFVPTPGDTATLVWRMIGPGDAVKADGVYGTQYHFRLIAVGSNGLASAPSGQASAVTKALVDTDIIGQIVAGANIKDGSITASDKVIANTITGLLIQSLAINTGHLKANAVTADKADFGLMTAMLLRGDAFETHAAWNRGLKITGAGLVGYSPSGVVTFRYNSSDGSVYIPGYASIGYVDANYLNVGNLSAGIANLATLEVNAPGVFNAGVKAYGTSDFHAPVRIWGAGNGLEVVDGSIYAYGNVQTDSSLLANRFTSMGTYNYTTSAVANLYINTGGTFARSGSSRAIKLVIEDLPDAASRALLDVPVRTWFDRRNTERYAAYLDGETDDLDCEALRRIPGVVAEEVEAAGAQVFVTYDDDGAVSGVAYDRIGVAWIPLVRELTTKVALLEQQLATLMPTPGEN